MALGNSRDRLDLLINNTYSLSNNICKERKASAKKERSALLRGTGFIADEGAFCVLGLRGCSRNPFQVQSDRT